MVTQQSTISVAGMRRRWVGLMRIALAGLLAAGLLLVGGAAAAEADQLNVSLGTGTPEQGLPLTVSYSGESTLKSFEGGSLAVYAATIVAYIRPAGGAPCQENSYEDAQIAGPADVSISGSKNFFEPGPISDTGTATPPAPGAYVLCAWLEVVNGDGIVTSTVLASTSTSFTAQGPQAHLTLDAPASAKPGSQFTVGYTTQTDQALTFSMAARPDGSSGCAANAELEAGDGELEVRTSSDPLDWLVNDQSVFGGPTATMTYATAPTAGQYLVCAWLEGPTAGEVDASASALVQVGTPTPPPPAPSMCPSTPAGARIVCFAEAILKGEAVPGWPSDIGVLDPPAPIPYVWGGGQQLPTVGPSLGTCNGYHGDIHPCPADTQVGLDCAGFTRWVYDLAFGHDVLGRKGNDGQRRVRGMHSVRHPAPGDLVFYGPVQVTNHVAIYVGSGEVIAEPKTGGHLERVAVRSFGKPTAFMSYAP
jgi:hypothetical protein